MYWQQDCEFLSQIDSVYYQSFGDGHGPIPIVLSRKDDPEKKLSAGGQFLRGLGRYFAPRLNMPKACLHDQ
jgi:hypothetical protein